ncbi:MAG: hypothetical protein HY980_01020 [Candidatus Magasanikbacteria bacterium]|nr:hypothetical protein [Candidatus Magasanikbacteria bacterium]
MFFRIAKIIIFFIIVAIFEIVVIYLYRPSLMIDAYRGDDESSIWITTRYFDFQRKISDTDMYKFADIEWSPNGRYFSYFDFVRLEWATKEWALKIIDARFFTTKTVFVGDYHTGSYEWFDDNTVRVCASAGSGVRRCRNIDIHAQQPIVAVDDYDSGAWDMIKTF